MAIEKDLNISFNIKITTISGIVTNMAGAPVSCGRVFWYPKWGPGKLVVADTDGVFSFNVVEGEEGTLVIPARMFDKKMIAPALPIGQSSVEYTDITPISRFDFPNNKFYI